MNTTKYLNYDPETGALTWAIDFMAGVHTRRAGEPVTLTYDTDGYAQLRLKGKRYNAAKLILEIITGEPVPPGFMVDHIDGNRANNRANNLRLATKMQNTQNACRRKDNTSGFKGVTYHGKTGKWVARVRANNERKYLGLFDTPELANAAAIEARKKLHKNFARHQ